MQLKVDCYFNKYTYNSLKPLHIQYNSCIQGRNDFAIFVITRELGILTWDEAFLSLRSTLLPDALRAKYCELIIGQFCISLNCWKSSSYYTGTVYSLANVFCSGLFIDVGTNYSVLDHTNLSFIYEDVLSPGPNADGEFVSFFFSCHII